MLIRFDTQLGASALGHEPGICPHCQSEQNLEQRELSATFMVVIPVSGHQALVCPDCRGVSRREGRGSRIFSALFMLPFALLLAVGFGTGLWMIVSSLIQGLFAAEMLVIAALLVVGAGYLEFRVVCAMRKLLSKQRIIALTRGLHTKL